MSIEINHAVDELQLDALIADGWTSFKLYYSNSPEGPYSDSGVTPSPATLALLLAAEAPFNTTFTYAAGNPAQWFKVLAYDGSSTSDLNDSQSFHGGGGTTLATLRQRIGLLTHTMKIGTTTSAGAANGSTAVANYAKFTRFRDDYFGGGTGIDGWFFNDLTTNNSWTVVSDWVQSTGTFTFSPVFGTQVGSGVNFEVMARWTPDEYRDAINWAIVESYPILSKTIVDVGTFTEDDIYVYDIPSSIRVLNKIEIESTNNSTSEDSRTRGHPWYGLSYTSYDEGLIRKVEFKRELESDRRLRFTGTGLLSQLYNDSDYVEILDPQINMLCYLAAHRLYAMLSNTDAASDVDRVRDQANYYLNLYNESKTSKRSHRRKPKMNWGHDARWNYS